MSEWTSPPSRASAQKQHITKSEVSQRGSATSGPQIVVKFWPPSITAKGARAIDAVGRPLAFAIYSRPFVAVAIGLLLVVGGSSYSSLGLRLLRGFVAW
jgi:hypothetical protein